MKYISLILFTFFYIQLGTAQNNTVFQSIKSSRPIPISDIKTTHFIFKDKIKYLDLGSRYFVTDTLENIVKVKHIGGMYTEKKEEKETNITIITREGDFFTVPLYFKRDIENTTYKFGYGDTNFTSLSSGVGNSSRTSQSTSTYSTNQNSVFTSEKKSYDTAELLQMCNLSKAASANVTLKGNRDLIVAKIRGIYYKDDFLSIKLHVQNFSTIDLDIDDFLFRFIKDKRFAKDQVYQERLLEPEMSCSDIRKVKGTGGSEIFTFVFKKFTPNVDEKLRLEILEEQGGRSTTIVIPRKRLLRPKVLK